MKKRLSLYKKLLHSFLLLSIAGFFVLLIMSYSHFKNLYIDINLKNLYSLANTIKEKSIDLIIKNDINRSSAFIKKTSQNSGFRISLIDHDGQVLADSHKDPNLLNNALTQPEIIQAQTKPFGRDFRFSESLNEDALYMAIALKHSARTIGYLRISIVHYDTNPTLFSYSWRFFVGVFLLALIFAILMAYITKNETLSLVRIQKKAKEFSKGHLKELIPTDPQDSKEVYSLVKSLNEMIKYLDLIFQKNEKKKNEREAIFQSMSEGVLSIHMDDAIFLYNPSVCHFFNIPYIESYKGKALIEVFRNKPIIELAQEIKNMISKPKSIIEKELPLKIGELKKTYLVRSSFILDPKSEPIGILFIFNDISRLKKLEDHRKEFVSNVSHELRTPLTSIQGYAESLMDEELSDLSQKFIKTIHRNSIRLQQIASDLLMLSEIDTHEAPLNFEFNHIDICSIIFDVIESLKEKANKKNIKIQIDCEHDKILVNLNQRLMGQAIMNLLDNAIKYSESSTHINIHVFKDLKNNQVQIKFCDEGVGIPSEFRSRIFERFFCVDKARSREQGGSGLGLSLVKHITLIHRGHIEMTPNTPKGSCFILTLPLS